MDIVITYVNGNDPSWIRDYQSVAGKEVLAKRFRDWGTLKFIFRGIWKYIPFVRKVHLVVSGESQVPEWVDRSKVNVVFHRDFIPEQYLPLFNSSSIEVFLHRIPGLDEEFIYLNDDFFPLRLCTPECFFRDAHPVIGMHRHLFAINSYKRRIRRSYTLACRAVGKEPGSLFLRPQHICYNLLRSSCEEIFLSCNEEILNSVSRLRNPDNYNISLFLDYIHLKGLSVNRFQSGLHISLGAACPLALRLAIKYRIADFLCINDVQMSDKRFKKLQSSIIREMSDIFPEQSPFEHL